MSLSNTYNVTKMKKSFACITIFGKNSKYPFSLRLYKIDIVLWQLCTHLAINRKQEPFLQRPVCNLQMNFLHASLPHKKHLSWLRLNTADWSYPYSADLYMTMFFPFSPTQHCYISMFSGATSVTDWTCLFPSATNLLLGHHVEHSGSGDRRCDL